MPSLGACGYVKKTFNRFALTLLVIRKSLLQKYFLNLFSQHQIKGLFRYSPKELNRRHVYKMVP